MQENPSSTTPGSEALVAQTEARAARKRKIKLIRGLLITVSGGVLVSSLIYWYANRHMSGSAKT